MADLSVLNSHLEDEGLTEIMWNRFDQMFVEREGKIQQATSPFRTGKEYLDFLDRLIHLDGTVGTGSLSFDGILPGGSRFHVTLPPLSPLSATLTIRKFARAHRGLDNLVAAGFMTPKCATFLENCVRGRLNILISGATGAGKTTLLNALASRVDHSERIITVEDIPEIQLAHANWVRLVAVRKKEGMTVRDGLVGSLRMRPDRIIVGECRSSEALEMLQAMNTGHDGGLTTLHANSSGDALTRLETLILFHAGAEIPLKALRRQIVDALDLVIQVRKMPSGQRGIEEILELVGMEGDVITRLPIFKRVGEKGQTRLTGTGHVPTFLKSLEEFGVVWPKGFFEPDHQ